MKFFHLADLHIGKRLHEALLLDDQEYILTKIVNAVDEEKPDGVIIAGDVYDKSLPSAEAVQLFDDFLYKLSKRKVSTFIISGNHDSPERISFGSRIMRGSGVYLSPVYSGGVEAVTLSDGYGELDVFMLPFIKPANVRRFYPDENIVSYTDAVSVAVRNMRVDKARRNVIVTHQFVTGAEKGGSEDISVGGSDNVDAAVFDAFDYVALGHIHGAQCVTRDSVRYSGTPLKYSFSEAKHKKSITVAELAEKGRLTLRELPLVPKREMQEISGSYMQLTAKSFYKDFNLDDYYHITLTDEDDVPEALGKLRTVYKNVLLLDYDNKRTRSCGTVGGTGDVRKSPSELFSEFYEAQNGQGMSDVQRDFVSSLIERIWEDVK